MGDTPSHASFPFGLEPQFWERLHNRVSPNTLTVECFANAVMNGTLGDHFLVVQIRRFAQAFREAMLERGDWAEMEHVRVSGRKNDMVEGMRRAVMQLNTGSSGVTTSSTTTTTASTSSSSSLFPPPPPSHAVAGAAVLVGRSGATSPLSQQCSPLLTGNHGVGGGGPIRGPSSVGLAQLIPPHLSTIPLPTLSGSGTAALGLGSGGGVTAHHTPPAAHSLLLAPAPSDRRLPRDAVPEPPPALSSSSPGVKFGTNVGTESSRALVLALNARVSPFYHVMHVMKTVALRYGSTPIKFQVPVHFAAGVQSRRLRVHILPYLPVNAPTSPPSDGAKHTGSSVLHPHKWPSVKDLVVYINDQGIQTPWKRTWPERAVEVAKTLLPLDITQYLSVSGGTIYQRAQIDIFHKEYTTHAAFAIVEMFTVEQVVERILLREVGTASLERLPQNTECAARLAESRRLAYELYHRIMDDDDDDDEDGGVVADDPVISTYCPLTRGDIKIPIRGRCCSHVQCVDLTNYLLHGQRGGYWNCVICDTELREEDIRVDIVLLEYLSRYNDSPPCSSSRGATEEREKDADGNDDDDVRPAPAASSSLPPRLRLSRRAADTSAVAGPTAIPSSFHSPLSHSPAQGGGACPARGGDANGNLPHPDKHHHGWSFYWHPARDGTEEEEEEVIVSDSSEGTNSDAEAEAGDHEGKTREGDVWNAGLSPVTSSFSSTSPIRLPVTAMTRTTALQGGFTNAEGLAMSSHTSPMDAEVAGHKRRRELETHDGSNENRKGDQTHTHSQRDRTVLAEEGTAANPIEL